MLEDISIKDFALIDNASIEFKKGFTVLSGETGAGKSLLIGALTFLLGGKSGANQIRTGAKEASVCGTFYLGKESKLSSHINDEDFEPTNAYEWLFLHGISVEDERILIRRFIRDTGKSGSWINDVQITRNELAEFCSFLVDIHGQHEHQNLMKVTEHRKYLDSYAGLTDRVRDFTALYTKLAEKKKTLEDLISNSKDRVQRIELLNFAIKEISDAKLKPNEDNELDDEETKLSSFEKLYSEIETINSKLDGGEGEGVISLLKQIRSSVSRCADFDKNLDNLSQRLDSVFYEISDISDEFSDYERNLVFDPNRLQQVQERQTLIYNLKKKYASSVSAPIEEVLSYLESAQKQLDELDGSEENQESLKNEIKELEKIVYTEAKNISTIRKEFASKMSASVVGVLSKLGMANTRFLVSLSDKDGTESSQKIGAYGLDNVEFLISANPGQPLQPLAKIASGGELSRVMLSLKTILASSDSVGTMIFDEIDTGIGGEVAVSIGSHLKKLAVDRQVLCITHLASIAVYADNQIKISKGVVDGMTKTSVIEIEGENRVTEIARMLSGDANSEESLEHARSMLERFS